MATDPSSLTTSDYIFLREEIRHEDNLINQRVSWLVSSQSFLLTGFAIAVNGPTQFRSSKYDALNVALVSLLPVAGVLTCIVSSLAIFAGIVHMRQIRELAGNAHPQHLPAVQGTPFTRRLGLAGPSLTPAIFLVVWLILLLRR